jgi:hypothetical protein
MQCYKSESPKVHLLEWTKVRLALRFATNNCRHIEDCLHQLSYSVTVTYNPMKQKKQQKTLQCQFNLKSNKTEKKQKNFQCGHLDHWPSSVIRKFSIYIYTEWGGSLAKWLRGLASNHLLLYRCGFESQQGFFILSCDETVQLSLQNVCGSHSGACLCMPEIRHGRVLRVCVHQ